MGSGCSIGGPFPDDEKLSPEVALMERIERRLQRWKANGDIPAYVNLKYCESYKAQVRDKKNNRFGGEMGAYQDSRVLVPGVEYVNASPLDILDEDDTPWIATMCPKDSTISAFWQMVWEYNCRIIVNLTGPHDSLGSAAENKREIYWPPFSCNISQQGWPVNVQTLSVCTTDEKFFVRIKVRLTKTNVEAREVMIFWYVNWVDMARTEDIMDQYFLENARNALSLAMMVGGHMDLHHLRKHWTVVHCSAGVGRTGTFVTIMHVLRQLENVKDIKSLDLIVWGCIERIRQRRLWMVKTPYEYATIFGAIHAALRKNHIQVETIRWDEKNEGWGSDEDLKVHCSGCLTTPTHSHQPSYIQITSAFGDHNVMASGNV